MQWLIDIITEKVLDSFKGIIVEWSGTEIEVPTGWQLCDGTNGTPDLRDRFIKCISLFSQIGDTGGSKLHNHDFTTDGHFHTLVGLATLEADGDYGRGISIESDTGTTSTKDGQPAFYKLAFIMKL